MNRPPSSPYSRCECGNRIFIGDERCAVCRDNDRRSVFILLAILLPIFGLLFAGIVLM